MICIEIFLLRYFVCRTKKCDPNSQIFLQFFFNFFKKSLGGVEKNAIFLGKIQSNLILPLSQNNSHIHFVDQFLARPMTFMTPTITFPLALDVFY